MTFSFTDALLIALVVGVAAFLIGYISGSRSKCDGEFLADSENPENCNLTLHKEIKDITKMRRINLKVISVKTDERPSRR